MSLMTQAIVAEKYGLRLTIEQIADALNLAKQTVYNRVAEGTLGVKTYLEGGKRFASFQDVAAYLDECRAHAK